MGKSKGEREKPPAVELTNSLSSHWRCYGECGWNSAAPDLHVISYFPPPAGSYQAPTLYVCLPLRNALQQWEIDLSEPVMRCTTHCTSLLSELGPRKLTEASKDIYLRT